ncbi:MAG: PAAR domain-containing protein [Polyangiaceae bacterium]
MSAPPVFPAAKKGDRVSHDPAASTRSLPTIVAALLGQSLASPGQGGVTSAQAGAASSSGGKGSMSVMQLVPRVSTGTIAEASPTVTVAPGIGAALAQAHPVDCSLHNDKPIAPGASTVTVQGLPLALTGAETECGAVICDGAPTVLVGGGPPASGAGAGTTAGSPIADAIARAEAIFDKVQSAVEAVQRGAELIEHTVTETIEKVEGAAQGAISAVTGAITSLKTGAGTLGALVGGLLTPSKHD